MDSVLISMAATAVFFMTTATLGFRLGRSAKPYGLVTLAIRLDHTIVPSHSGSASAGLLGAPWAVVGPGRWLTLSYVRQVE